LSRLGQISGLARDPSCLFSSFSFRVRAILQDKPGMTHVPALDIRQACIGFIYLQGC